jgi:hypothetical protein
MVAGGLSPSPGTRDFWKASGIRRVDSYIGREMFRRRKGDLAGIIANIFPGEGRVREYRLHVSGRMVLKPENPCNGGFEEPESSIVKPLTRIATPTNCR